MRVKGARVKGNKILINGKAFDIVGGTVKNDKKTGVKNNDTIRR